MPNSRNSARRRVLTIATLMAATPAIAVLGQTSLDTGDPGGRRVVAESRFGVTNARLQAKKTMRSTSVTPRDQAQGR